VCFITAGPITKLFGRGRIVESLVVAGPEIPTFRKFHEILLYQR
jgi:hypothetical protein